MTTHTEIAIMANKVLSLKHLTICEALDQVCGTFCDANKALQAAVFDEAQAIRFPHGYGEDAINHDC